MKDSFYFPHDYYARNDPKLIEVVMEHGMAGIGVFWCLIEMLYEQDGKLPLASCKSIAFVLHVECTIVESIIFDFGLFENDGDFFFSPSVSKRNQKRQNVSEQRKIAAKTRWDGVKNQQDNANAMQNNASADVCNAIKEKKRKEKNNILPNGNMGKTKVFTPPTTEEVNQYMLEKGITNVDAQRFVDFYESKGWLVGKAKMKDWRAAVRNWSRDDSRRPKQANTVHLQKNDLDSIWGQ